MDQHGIEESSKISTVSATRCGEAVRRTTSRTEETISGRRAGLRRFEQRQQLEAQPRAAERELLGDQDVRRLGANSSSSSRARSALKASSSGVPSRRHRSRSALVGRAQRRQLMEARAAQRQARDGRAARHQQHVEAAAARARAKVAARRRWPMPSRCCTWKKTRALTCIVSGTFRRSTVRCPSPRAVKKCRQLPVELVRRPAGHVPAGRQRQQGADRGLVRHGDDRPPARRSRASSASGAPWRCAATPRPAAGSRARAVRPR